MFSVWTIIIITFLYYYATANVTLNIQNVRLKKIEMQSKTLLKIQTKV